MQFDVAFWSSQNITFPRSSAPVAYLKFQLKGGALIGMKVLDRRGCLLSFPFNELKLK